MKTMKTVLLAGILGLGFLSAGCGAKYDPEKAAKCATGQADQAACDKCCAEAGGGKGIFASAAGMNTCGCPAAK